MATMRFQIMPIKNTTNGQILATFNQGQNIKYKYLGYNIPLNKNGNDYKYWNKKTQRVRGLDAVKVMEINDKIEKWEYLFRTYISDCNRK